MFLILTDRWWTKLQPDPIPGFGCVTELRALSSDILVETGLLRLRLMLCYADRVPNRFLRHTTATAGMGWTRFHTPLLLCGHSKWIRAAQKGFALLGCSLSRSTGVLSV